MPKKTNREDSNEKISRTSESEIKSRIASSDKSQLSPSPEKTKLPSQKHKDALLTNFSDQKPVEHPVNPLEEDHRSTGMARVVIIEEIDSPFIEAPPPNSQNFFEIIVHRVRPQPRR